ncbi:hypothetical protein GCM10017667_54800 [Streptomyces filamentosus]|uniref:DUF8094 domain-containing protein n=2 Tax=Streptomyces filamentosus TaxID=67294 RepID=A0A919BTA5_STRFL|nr:hypothetical protein GCM10017667_54800 [Streptomyces filamentosus]
MAHILPTHRRSQRITLLLAATAAALSACSPSDTSAHDGPTGTSATTAAPRGAVTRAEADRILDRYQEINNKANKARDAGLLATVEAGQLYARSKADYEQFDTLSAQEKKDAATPFFFTRRTFYIPPADNWFAAAASTNGTNHTFMIFEKSADTGGTWKKVVSLFPQQPLPDPQIKDDLAVPADEGTPVGNLAPSGVTDAIEDLFTTGGTKDGSKLSHANANASAKAILKTYKERRDHLGAKATVNFFPIAPTHNKTYTLTTSSGVLVITALAHKEESLVTNAGLQISPSEKEAVYNKTPRSLVVDSFQGEAVVHLPRQGKPEILDYRYALVDSR